MNLHFSIVNNESVLSKFVQEEAHPRSWFRSFLLAFLAEGHREGHWAASLPKFANSKKASEAPFAGIE
jgi:hypothetical protein